MATFNNIDEAKAYFTGDRFAAVNGMVIELLDEDSCTCSMDITADHRNAYGGVMGGVIFTLADFAIAVTANQIHNVSVVQNASISYLNGVKGDRLIASTECVKNGKSSTVINAVVRDDTGELIAQLTATAYKMK